MSRWTRAIAMLWLAVLPAAAGADTSTYAAWIDQMKTAERGPFSQIRWFCKDGAVLPPKASACAERGGGYQHGEWSERTQALRGKGYLVGNVLAGIDAESTVAKEGFPDELGQLLVEKYLVAVDDGWIFRRAQFYRGATQEEDERAGGRELLLAMAASPDWTGYRYVALRTAARFLPHGRETASVQKVRQEAAALSDLDPGFAPLRAKIHGTPEAKDAGRVREYAAKARADLRPRYEALAAEIDGAYAPVPLADTIERTAATMRAAEARDRLRAEAARLRQVASDTERFLCDGDRPRRAAGRVRPRARRRGPAAPRRPEPRRRGRELPPGHGAPAGPRRLVPRRAGAAPPCRRRGRLRRGLRQLPPAARARRGVRCAGGTRAPSRRLPRAAPRDRPPPRLGHPVAAHALLRALARSSRRSSRAPRCSCRTSSAAARSSSTPRCSTS